MKNLEDVINSKLCLGCGLCSLNHNTNENHIKLKYSSKLGHNIPNEIDKKSENAKLGFDICPGKGYKINTMAKEYGLSENFHIDLGFYDKLKIATNNFPQFLQHASSSGIMTKLASYLIENKIVDKAIVTKFEYTKNGPVSSMFITDNSEDLIEAQGSKYCPVDLSVIVKELKSQKSNKKFVFIGTPCQIAGLRYIQKNIEDLGIQFFIGNFCGGFKSYNNLKQLIKLNGINPREVNHFRFRGGGQPGSLKIETLKKVIDIPYPEYVKMTGYSKLKRCHLCVDATAELADFSCGDAWLKEHLDTKIPNSIVITRTKEASNILERMRNSNLITINDIKFEKVIESQNGNIRSKKYRQNGRMKFFGLLKIKTPEITEGYHRNEFSFRTELNVFLSHKIKFVFEKLGLFYHFYYKNKFSKRILFKIFKDNYN